MRLHAIDVAADDLVVLAEADLVVLAAPARQNIALLETLDENVRQPAVVTDTSSTKRAIGRGRARAAAPVHICRRSSTRRSGERRAGTRADRPVPRPPLAADAHRRRRRACAREAHGICPRARCRAARHRRRRARSAAGLSQSSSAIDRKRTDAGCRRRGRPRGARALRPGAWPVRRGSRRARPTSGRTSRPPMRTRSDRRWTR